MTLFYQQIRGDDPVHTSLEPLPFAIMAFIVNIVAGWLLGIVRGDVLIGVGLLGTMVRILSHPALRARFSDTFIQAAPLIFSLIDVHASYWTMAFFIMLTISWTDVAYTVGNLQVSISFDADSQGLAGGIFNVATRLGTSIALALSSSVATAVSDAYNARHPDLAADDKDVLMAGFRAAGWVSFALAAASFAVCVFGIRGIGVIGRKMHEPGTAPTHVDETGPSEKPKALADVSPADSADALPLGDLEKGLDAPLAKRVSVTQRPPSRAQSPRLSVDLGNGMPAQVIALPDIVVSSDARRTSVSVQRDTRRSSVQAPGAPARSTSL